MGDQGKCILCIVDAGPLPEAAPHGFHAIHHRDLAAVVRDVPLPPAQPTRQDLVAHLRAIEEIMATRTVIPVGFGSIAHSEEEVRRGLLASRYEEWRALLAHLAGKAELGLKVLWSGMEAVFAEILAEREDLRALRDALARGAGGADLSRANARDQKSALPGATYQQRLQVGRLVAEALEDKRRREGAAIRAALAPLAVEVRDGKLLAERMILNSAFLVERRREPEFDRAVSHLAQESGQRLAFKYVGPAPPFNFVSV